MKIKEILSLDLICSSGPGGIPIIFVWCVSLENWIEEIEDKSHSILEVCYYSTPLQ